MTNPTILSKRTWTTTEPDEGDRHRYATHVTWTETVQIRDMTPEERAMIERAKHDAAR